MNDMEEARRWAARERYYLGKESAIEAKRITEHHISNEVGIPVVALRRYLSGKRVPDQWFLAVEKARKLLAKKAQKEKIARQHSVDKICKDFGLEKTELMKIIGGSK